MAALESVLLWDVHPTDGRFSDKHHLYSDDVHLMFIPAGDVAAMLLFLLACANAPSLSSVSVAQHGSAQRNLHARPPWSASVGFSPGLSQHTLQSLPGVVDAGALEQVLLRCTVHSQAGHGAGTDRVEAWLYMAELGVRTTAAQLGVEMMVGAPVGTLVLGDQIQVVLRTQQDDDWVVLDTLHGEYGGQLPVSLRGQHTQGSCLRVAEDALSAALDAVMADVDEALMHLDERVVTLAADDFGRSLTPVLSQRLEAAAALVGWAHPAVQQRIQVIDRADDAFVSAVMASIATHTQGTANGVEFSDTSIVVDRMLCPGGIGYWRHGIWAECVLELDAEMGSVSDLSMDLVYADGVQAPAYLWSVDENAHMWTPAVAGGLSVDSRRRVMIRFRQNRPPVAIRIREGGRIHWLSVHQDR